ncbi:MAG: FkbM family methyltransferase [Patescibacteria group bacterium]|nr:FkbM family methyltransferase [Patescibacteria group bacterium]MDD5490619.1 FkbM family methyltransferase [Patescibacteria group bacterium]
MQQEVIKFNGRVYKIYPRDEADRSVVAEIFKLREYRAAEEAIKSASEPIIDVGAHAGFFTLYARSFNDRVKIFALEPEAKNREMLKKHLTENEISGVKVLPVALGGKSGEGRLCLSADSHNHRLAEEGGECSDFVKVSVVSLGDLLRLEKIKKIPLLKMDIEGGEFEVFKGLAEGEWERIKAIILEYHNFNNRSHKELEGMLREKGFGTQIFPSKFEKNMGFLYANNKNSPEL